MPRFVWRRSDRIVKRKNYGSNWGYRAELLFTKVVVVLTKIRFRGWRVECIRKRDDESVIVWSRPPKERTVKKRKMGSSGDPTDAAVHLAAVETILMGQFPCIVAHLITTKWDDGTPRTPGTLMVKTMGSSYALTLKEPDDALQMTVLAQTIDDVFELAETLLGGDKAPWESDPWQRQRNTKGRK